MRGVSFTPLGENRMTLYDLKPRFQNLLHPLTHALFRAGVTANQVTCAAALASVAYGLSMLWAPASAWPYLLLPLFLLLRMALNAIDGMLARQYQQQSELGAILNEVGDVVSDACLYLPFFVLPGSSLALGATVLFLSLLTEFVGLLGHVTGAGRRYDGPLGKSDRALVFGALALLFGLGVPLAPWFNFLSAALCVLLAWTCWNRARKALA
jgi:CDP-diacylglycerol--glycerol-3-phosphate 3-phosphatidyltransferase